jgi:hypothetical protein
MCSGLVQASTCCGTVAEAKAEIKALVDAGRVGVHAGFLTATGRQPAICS